MEKFPLTVLIPTYNEEANLPQLLNSIIDWSDQIILIDSYSTDNTLVIAKKYGLEIFQHKYENMASQRDWAINLPIIKNDWILNLDADELITDELKSEINKILISDNKEYNGFQIRRRHYFLGKWMKHGGDYIWLLRLIRKGKCRIIKTPIINEHTIIQGKIGKLKSDFIHHPKKDFTAWIQRQNTGSQKFALSLCNNISPDYPNLNKDEKIEGKVRSFLNYRVYAKFPLFIRPFVRFIVFYIFRMGFLDGWQGFVYHVSNDFIYPFLVWAKYKEYSTNPKAKEIAEMSNWR